MRPLRIGMQIQCSAEPCARRPTRVVGASKSAVDSVEIGSDAVAALNESPNRTIAVHLGAAPYVGARTALALPALPPNSREFEPKQLFETWNVSSLSLKNLEVHVVANLSRVFTGQADLKSDGWGQG